MRRLLFIILTVSFFASGIHAQTFRGGLPFFTNYHPSDYKGYSQNWSITSNSKGVLFFANGDGIMIYNGRSWSKILLNNNATPTCFMHDDNDVIWVGAQSELGCLLPDYINGYRYVSLTSLINNANREFGFIVAIHKTEDGIYFKAGAYIFRLVKKQIFTIPVDRGSFMFEFNKKLFLYEPEKGFSTVSGNKLLRVIGETPPPMIIRRMIPQSNHSAIFVDRNNGLQYAEFDFSNQYAVGISVQKKFAAIDNFLIKNEASDAIRLANGNYAFATVRNGTIVTDSNFQVLYHLSREAGVMNETHNFLYEDAQYNLWMALDHGICKVNSQSPLTCFNDYQGVKGSVLDITRFAGKIFVATWQGVFFESSHPELEDGNIFKTVKQIKSQTWDLETAWIGGRHVLFAATSDGIFAIDSTGNGISLHEGNYNYVKVDPKNNLRVYAGGPLKIEFFDFSRGLRKPEVSQVPDLKSRVVNAALTENNELFIGTARDGVFVFSAVRISENSSKVVFDMHIVNTQNGLPPSDAYYVFVYGDKLLVGTQTGLYEIVQLSDGEYSAQLFDSRFVEFYTQSKFINILKADDNGNMWFQTNSKLSGRKSLFYFIKNKGEFVNKPFQTFPDIEFYSISPEKDSVVWFGSDDGVFRFSWKVSNTNRYDSKFQTVLQRVSHNNFPIYSGLFTNSFDSLLQKGESEFVFSGGSIRFDFSAGYYINENLVKFTYYLEGFDRKWSDPSIENYKEYTNLPPGEYVFNVKAINPFGVEGIVASFHFSVPSPWYFRWWAWAMYILFAAAIIFGSIAFANRRLIKAKLRLEQIVHSRTLEIQNQKKAIEIEKEKADKLLINILPVRIAEELKSTGHCQTEFYQNVTVLFTDFCGFTAIAETMDPEELVSKLDEIFAYFDDVCSRNKLEKIKTIGDSHMSAGGIPVRNRTHAVDSVLAAMEMQQFLEKFSISHPENEVWKLRIGINSGELTAGVVGKRKFAFDIWGDTVNTASRLQDMGAAGKINISSRTAELVSAFFDLTYRGKKPIKHKGEIDMFFVDGIKPELSIDGKGERPNQLFWSHYNELLDMKYLNF